ncbi:T9SS type A sorting domain-containing protein [Spirosoma rhododendri]|uniref:Secretion system C-terminal sorting domain-containing protein n=1 Tax=Spirosoma rhododendri TaxID=2728024 RepID=A0A7L5DP73_9BACT|nr:hypothetical protein [Spirosoma rhododendri]QJD80259.1 hypothetical protein HH216_18915 [Spirosoma rhododendri]
MKTLVTSLLVAFTLVSSAVSFCEAKPIVRPVKQAAAYEVSMYTATNGNLRLALDKQKGGRVTVSMKNDKGNTLFTQYVGKRETQSRFMFDISALPDGVYTVEISNGAETKTQELTINTPKEQLPARQIALN